MSGDFTTCHICTQMLIELDCLFQTLTRIEMICNARINYLMGRCWVKPMKYNVYFVNSVTKLLTMMGILLCVSGDASCQRVSYLYKYGIVCAAYEIKLQMSYVDPIRKLQTKTFLKLYYVSYLCKRSGFLSKIRVRVCLSFNSKSLTWTLTDWPYVANQSNARFDDLCYEIIMILTRTFHNNVHWWDTAPF